MNVLFLEQMGFAFFCSVWGSPGGVTASMMVFILVILQTSSNCLVTHEQSDIAIFQMKSIFF